MIAKLKQLQNHEGFMKYFKNTGWLFGEKILRMIVGLFVGVWMARYLGPDKFGLLDYSMSFVGIFTAISTFGLDSIIIRELVKNQTKSNLLIGTTFWIKLAGSFLVFFFLAIAVKFTSNDYYTNKLIFIIASATIFQSWNVIDFFFRSKVLSRYIVYVNTGGLLLSSIIKIILILRNEPLIYFAYLILWDSSVLACGYIYIYIKNNQTFKNWKFDKKTAFLLLRDSWPLIISGIAISVYVKIDQIMIKEMIGINAVGKYAVAVRFSEIWYFIPMAIVSSVFPAIINAKKNNEELYNYRLKKLYKFMIILAIIIVIPMTFLGNWIINLLYGSLYSGAGIVLKIHIWSLLFVFIGIANGQWLICENLQIFSTINTFLGAIINIVLNYFLITKMGIEGAAWATVISYAFSGYILLLIFKKTRTNFWIITKTLFIKQY